MTFEEVKRAGRAERQKKREERRRQQSDSDSESEYLVGKLAEIVSLYYCKTIISCVIFLFREQIDEILFTTSIGFSTYLYLWVDIICKLIS